MRLFREHLALLSLQSSEAGAALFTVIIMTGQ